MSPYVVSCDLVLLWKSCGITVVDDAVAAFRAAVQTALRDSVGGSEWIPEQELSEGLTSLLMDSPMPVISLDPVYAPRRLALNLTRLVNQDGSDAGYGLRNGDAVNLETAVAQLAVRCESHEIAVADDVIFSGSMMAHLISLFARHNVTVRKMFAGVSIGEGEDRLQQLGCEVSSVRSYPEVLDEICERDFLPGTPMCGRSIAGIPKTGAPYILPFGRPELWASIPKAHEVAFSIATLRAGADFYEPLGLRVQNLPRQILNLGVENDVLICDALRDCIVRLE